MIEKPFSGKVVLVTGAGRGAGRRLARRIAAGQGCDADIEVETKPDLAVDHPDHPV